MWSPHSNSTSRCPNVKTGLDFGADPAAAEGLIAHVRPLTVKPLIVKLTPNATDSAAVAEAARDGGADAVSLINTLRAMPLHPRRGEPWLGGRTGGASGPAIRTIALAQVAQVAARVDIPSWAWAASSAARDARDIMRAGATIVAVGTESFRDPLAATRIVHEMTRAAPRSPETPSTAR